ncbi:MAG TPA: SPOR domain-containing protein [Polyangiales bacterium]|nr:SPOR domain-containing protein [Polyangiales bacterium]
MENRVRDLEQMEERDPEDRGRRIGMVVMATLGIVGLTFAMGVVVGKAAEPSDASGKDPLDQLDRVAAASGKPGAITKAALGTRVEAADLSFPKSLTEEEDRPEVIAALEAAAREDAALDAKNAAAEGDEGTEKPAVAAPAAPAAAAAAVPAIPAAALAPAAKPQPTAANDADDEASEERVQTMLPASVAAGSAGQKLAKAAKHDQLVAASLPTASPKERAPHGEEGEYTLQVISYDNAPAAQSFASGLRAKGHEAFVTAADVPERGRYYRVRIGPFATRDKAESYRHKFEDDEHMNIIVVKRSKDDER